MLTASPRTIGRRALGVVLEHVLALPPAGEVERDERRSRARRARSPAPCTLICAPVGDFTQTYSPSLTPRSLASFGLISTKFSCCSSASHGFERVSSPPPSYSTRRPRRQDQREVLGDLLFDVLLLHRSCTASAGARTPSCRRASDTWRPGRDAANRAARGAAGCRRGNSRRSRAPWRCRRDGSRASCVTR